jgi:hypothetical protein|tara:strand:- start:172 stop:507 length:336 start_codon:yes stop_codon:yes gene_type:complete
MTSVITSARTSTASLFDMFGDTANAASKLIKTTSRSIDALDAKVNLMTASVIADSKGRIDRIKDSTAKNIAIEALELEEQIHHITNASGTFDKADAYATIYASVTASIAAD